jgi:hypothetical protein
MDTITQNGGVFEGAIYAQYLIPNSPAAFVTVQWVQDNLVGYLTQNGYMRAGNGVQLDSNGEILSIDSGLLV